MSAYKVHRIRFVEYVPKAINATAFENNGDHSRLALSREDGSIEILNPSANFCVDQIIPGNDERNVQHLEWCDGRLFSSSVGGAIIEWNLELLQPKYHQDSYGGAVWCFKFSHSKNMLAAGCEDGSIRLFEVVENNLLYTRCLNKQEHRILCLSWSYDDTYIVTGGHGCPMNMCSVKTGQVVSQMTTNKSKVGKTLVWAMEILSNFTIVIGDSLGNTQFWDGKMGTLSQSFNAHLSDVLAVAVSEDETLVYSCGIDSKVVEFKLACKVNEEKWVMTTSMRATRYDLRTLTMCGAPYNCFVSGGIDPRLIVCPISGLEKRKFTRYSCLPKKDACQLAPTANLLSYRDQHNVHVWSLSSCDDKQNSKPMKLFQIKSDRPEHLICHAISKDGSYLAYSTINRAQLFELDADDSSPSLKKSSIKIPPATKLCFSNSEEFLITVGHGKYIHVFNVENGESNIICIPDHASIQLPFLFLSISHDDNYVCVVDSFHKPLVLSLKKKESILSIPKMKHPITCCMFHPKKNNVFFATSKKEVYEYNITKEKFDSWCLDLDKYGVIKNMGYWKHRLNIAINPKSSKEIFFQSTDEFCKIIHGCQISAAPDEKLKAKRARFEEILKVSSQYQSMMFFDFNSNGEIVVVERPESAMMENLTAPLKIKKFGS